MSDNGNMYAIGMKLANWGVPMPPNVGGRFTNGPVVLEIMSYILNVPLLNYAFGGAMSGYDSLIPAYGFNIGMNTEVDDFIGNLGLFRLADSKALYVIWTGPDDFYKGVNMFNVKTVSTVTNNINSAMTKLYKKGARNFFIPLMPDLSITPSARMHEINTTGYTDAAHNRSNELQASLTAMLKSFAKQYPLSKVRTFDTYTVLTVEKQKYEAMGGYNVTDSCYEPPFMGLPGPVCNEPDKYLFWDGNHPTSWVSKIIGGYFATAAVGAALPSR
jgi:phospholipase/lecithinase/hemolysin